MGWIPLVEKRLAKQFCWGWFIGDMGEKKALEKDLRERNPVVAWEKNDLRELNEAEDLRRRSRFQCQGHRLKLGHANYVSNLACD